MIPTRFTRLTCISAMLLLAACTEAVKQSAAQEPTADTACALDGMVLQDFPGPKAQIQYAEGKPDFYCDLAELFGVIHAPEQKRRVAGLFVQDMGKADWARPQGHWIEAKSALYVVGSRRIGSMGPAIASFATAPEAAAFVKAQGGKVVSFDQVTAGMAMRKE